MVCRGLAVQVRGRPREVENPIRFRTNPGDQAREGEAAFQPPPGVIEEEQAEVAGGGVGGGEGGGEGGDEVEEGAPRVVTYQERHREGCGCVARCHRVEEAAHQGGEGGGGEEGEEGGMMKGDSSGWHSTHS